VRRLLILLALVACTPAATAPTPTSSAALGLPTTGVVTVSPSPAPTSTPSPTPTPSPSPQTLASLNDVHNEGQKIFVSLDTPLAWFFGEGSSSPGTNIANYRLNGASLAGSALHCTKIVSTTNSGCAALVIVPSIRLVNGTSYELALLGDPIGAFRVDGLVEATPHVVSASATQYDLTVTFDRPMLHAGDCGATTWSMSTPGTIEFVHGTGGFPAPPGAYTSTSDGYRDYLTSFVSEAVVSADCRTVTFGSGWGSVTGTIELIVAAVEDVDGNRVEPATISLTITDTVAPKLMFADVELQTAQKKVIRVAFSEAMRDSDVRDAAHYRLNNNALPASTVLECEIASCTWVRLTFAPSAFTYGAMNTLRVSDVRDLSGKMLDPSPATSAAFPVY